MAVNLCTGYTASPILLCLLPLVFEWLALLGWASPLISLVLELQVNLGVDSIC